MNNFFKKNQQGFTLLETLFAVLIFSAALVALMTIAGRGISAAQSAREQTIAHYLAQEGLETVRNVRDSNYDAGVAWDAGFGSGSQTCATTAPCMVVYGSGNPHAAPCASQQNPACIIFQDPTNGMFSDIGNPSEYQRNIVIIPGAPDQNGIIDEYQVVSTVMWTSKSIPRTVSLSTVLKNWE